MYVFIAIIFIAELIIAGAVIGWIVRTDKKVNIFVENIKSTMTDSVNLIKDFRSLLENIQGIMEKTVGFVSRKKREFKQKILNLILIYLVLVVFKVRFKKAASILQYLFIINDLWKAIP